MTKYLVILAVIVAVFWFARSRAAGKRPPRRRDAAAKPPVQPMVSCAHCGVHLPRDDAVSGAQGLYCSEAHRLAHGDPR